MSGPYIQVLGGTIDLLSPDPSTLRLDVMARSIAHLDRYTGHVGTYSVAEHCVLGTRLLRRLGHNTYTLRGFLTHDLSEAITGDVSAPMKRAMRKLAAKRGGFDPFAEIERRVVEAVEHRFSVDTQGHAVKEMDAAMCVAEALLLFGEMIGDGWPTCHAADVEIERWSPERAFQEYMRECEILGVM